LKMIRAPKRTIAQDAPSKKLTILLKLASCIIHRGVFSALPLQLHQLGTRK
jgi:hypothetical protein